MACGNCASGRLISGGCGCALVAGSGVQVIGNGTADSPWTVTSSADTTTTIIDNGDGSFSFSNEQGQQTTIAICDLLDALPDGTITAGKVLGLDAAGNCIMGDSPSSFSATGQTGPTQVILSTDTLKIIGATNSGVTTTATGTDTIEIDVDICDAFAALSSVAPCDIPTTSTVKMVATIDDECSFIQLPCDKRYSFASGGGPLVVTGSGVSSVSSLVDNGNGSVTFYDGFGGSTTFSLCSECGNVPGDTQPVLVDDVLTFTLNSPSTYDLLANDTSMGDGPSTVSLSVGTLPPGMTLSSAGVLSGTPTTSGTFSFAYSVIDSDGDIANANVVVAVAAPPIARADSATRNRGVATSVSLSANDDPGTSPSTWTQVSGTIPPGMTLGTDGSLYGTPTTAGTYTFSYRITDANSLTSEASVTITIATVNSPPVANNDTITGRFFTNQFGSYYVGTNDSWDSTQAPVTFSFVSGSIPNGLTLSTNGNLSGTPTTAQTSTFTYRLTDVNGLSDTATITVTVAASASGATALRFYYGGDGIFYTPIEDASVQLHPNSSYLASQLAANNSGYSGDRGVTTESYARTIVDWDETGTTYTMVVINDGANAGAWGGEDWGFNTITYYYPTVKIRSGAVIPSGTDGNLVIRDWARDREIDMWVANIDESSRVITCLWGGVYPANGDGTSFAPNYAPPSQYAQSWPSAADRAAGRNMIYTCCASGLSCTAGLISLADIQSGSIDHALAFSTDITRGPPQGNNLAFYYPATSTDGQYTGSNYLEEGSRVQLQMSDAAINAIPGVGNRMVARALKKYGAFCNDRGGSRMSFISQRPANSTERAIYQSVGWNGSDWNSWNGVGIDWSTLRVLIPA